MGVFEFLVGGILKGVGFVERVLSGSLHTLLMNILKFICLFITI